MVLAQVSRVHAAERVLLELAAHNAHTLGVHVPHALQQVSYCSVVVRHSVQSFIRMLLLQAPDAVSGRHWHAVRHLRGIGI